MMQLVDVLGWSEFSIMGHSLGGMVGQLMAAIAPERVKKIALIDVVGMISYPGDAVVSRLRNYLLTSKNIIQHAIYSSLEEAAIKRVSTSAAGKLSVAAARILAEGGMKKVTDGYMWTFDDRLQLPSAISLTNEQANAILTNFSSDSVLIAGSEGILNEYAMQGQNIENFQNIKTYKLEGGHHLHLDTPESVAKILADFFKRA